MLNLKQQTTKTLLSIHGWGAVLLGVLLYWVIFTGTVAVFSDEISDWASPLSQPVEQVMPRGTDAMLRRAAAQVDPSYLDEIILFGTSGGRLRAFFHTHVEQEDGSHTEAGELFVFDPTSGEVLSRTQGTREEIEAQSSLGKLGHFFVDWHVQLHLPQPWGLILTGILGLALLSACITGFAVHRHLIRDAFLRRKRGDDLLTAKDAHVAASTWNLPFAFILAFTGSFYSLASAFAIPAIAIVAFGGDQDKLIETVQGVPAAHDPRPAEMVNVDRMLAEVRASGGEPRFMVINHWGRKDAALSIFPWQAEGELLPKGYEFDPLSGDKLGVKPTIGQAPSIGGDLVALMAPLHFGNFAGLASKAVWFALGFAGAYVCISGMVLWVRRRDDNARWQHLLRLTLWSAWGLPLAMVAASYAYFLHQASVLTGLVEPQMFQAFAAVLALAAVLAWGVRQTDRVSVLLSRALAVSLVLLPLVRLATGGPGWGEALSQGLVAVWGLDIAFIAAGMGLILRQYRRTRQSAHADRAVAQLEAEHS